MNKLMTTTAIAAVLAVTHPANAGSWKDAPYIAPDWTGVYVGAYVGGAIPSFDNRWNPGIFCDDDFETPAANCGKAIDDLDDPGALVGGVIGYNRQYGEWLFGLEIDAASVLLENATYYFGFDGERTNSERSELKIDALVSARLRAGFVFDDTLLYATAGIGYVSAEFSASTSNTHPRMGIETISEFAPVLGAGLEHRVSENWTVDFNVQHYFVREKTFVGNLGDGETTDSVVDFKGLTTVNLGFRHRF